MTEKIVQSDTGITIIGGGRVRKRHLAAALKLAPFILAADGGAGVARKHGQKPDAVIGDMDGKTGREIGVSQANTHRISEQQTTDFEKCLYSLTAPFAIALGVTGTRFDHSLASVNCLMRYRAMPLVVVGGKDLMFLCPPDITLTLPIGTRLSLFPMVEMTGHSRGLEWAINDVRFSPLGRIGTSNRTSTDTVELGFETPGMLVLLPWKHLPAVVQTLRASAP